MVKKSNINQIKKEAFEWSQDAMDHWWYKGIRYAAVYVGKVLIHTPITANFLTVFMSVCWIFAGVLISFEYFIWGLVFMLLGEFVDYFDGIVARGKNQKSPYLASYLDAMYHQLTPSFIILGLGFSLWKSHNIYLVLGVLGCISQILTNYLFNFRNF